MARLEFPTIYLLPTRVEPERLPELESNIPSLTYDINEASVILGNISKRERAIYELRRNGIYLEEIAIDSGDETPAPNLSRSEGGPINSAKVSCPESDGVFASQDVQRDLKGTEHSADTQFQSSNQSSPKLTLQDTRGIVQVVRLNWFTDSVTKGTVLPVDKYLIYQGHKVATSTVTVSIPKAADILKRARDDGDIPPAPHSKHPRTSGRTKQPALLIETTSEGDGDLPPVPEFLHTTYSCQRPTPSNPPNSAFIEELIKIRTLRALDINDVGVRAYSTSIATLSAYPHLLTRAREVAQLPGCAGKISLLYQEWKTEGRLQEVENADKDPRVSVLKLFNEIWGVGETTARDFYNKGWTELDDIVEHGWNGLSRVQQIGVKYYDEFLVRIPRPEVEAIADIILSFANMKRKGFQMTIAGGYRRGKKESGDVDVILSHPEQDATHNLISELVTDLQDAMFITHTLTLSTRNSERGQAPLAWKGEGRRAHSGFDTLDKALVVWQNPDWDKSSTPKNPNLHRRVDIIISPWKTVGCALLGWSGATTFERDLRRYCKQEKSLKFDSSGIRSRIDGHWVDLESGPDGPAPNMLTAEKRVFKGLGLEWRPPVERCTN